MTTVTLRIAVDKAGASENIAAVKQDLRSMGEAGQQGGQQAAQGMGALQGAINGAKAAVASFLAVYAGIQALSGVVRLADEYQGLTDRLRLATGSSGEFAAAQQGVFAVAQQTGTALSAVGGLYVSLANSTRELNLSQSQLQTITQAVSQSFVISGASAAQTDAAIRQLGQGFASGVLRGDEFNSMMENAPALAAALAASLGVTTGQLRAMAAEGQLTSDVLATGLLNQAPQIAAQFDQMGTTVGQAFTRLSNSVLQFVGEAAQSTGAASALAAAITTVANYFPAFAAGLTAVAAGYVAVTAAAAVANPAIGFTGTMMAGLAAAIGVVVAAYSAFKLGEYLANEFESVRAAGASLVIGLNAAWEAIKVGVAAVAVALRIAFVTAIDTIQEKIADLIQGFVQLAQFEIFGQTVDFTYLQADALNALADSLRGSTDAATATDAAVADLRAKMDESTASTAAFTAEMFDGIDAHFETRQAADANAGAHEALVPALKNAGISTKELKEIQEAATRAADNLTQEQERLAAEMGGPAVAAAIELAQRLRSVDERQQDLTRAYDSGAMSLGDYQQAMQRANGVREQAIGLYQREATAIANTTTAVQQYLAELREDVRIAGLSGTARQAAIIRINAEAEARRLLRGATQQQIDALADEIEQLNLQGAAAQRAGQAAEDWQRYWDGAVTSVSDAFGDFVAGGLRDFESFGDSLKNIARQIMSDLVSQFARRIIMNLGVNTSGGGFGGGQGGFDIGGMIQGLFGGGSNSQNLGLTRINVINGSQTSGGAGGFGSMMGGGMLQNGFSMGGAIGAGGGIAMGLQGIRTGNVLQGAAGGAMAGMQIGGPWGALIGGIIGALGAAIHGKPKPDFRVGGASSNVRNPEGSFETVFGRVRAGSRLISWEELQQPIQEFDQAIQDLVLSTGGGTAELDRIRDALSRWSVDLREEAATAENVLGSRFSAVLSTFSENVREFVGNAGTVEERVGRLADALTIERIAGNENGITNSFDEMAELLTRFRVGNENLAETFARLGVGLEFVDQTMAMLQATFSGTRLEAATFAGELIELAGGFDAFASRMQGALTALFSDEERNQFLADQAQNALNASLTGLNISGVGLADIREQLRTQLRQAMEAGNAELTNQILIAANALGAFSSALEALGEDAVASANQMAFGGTSLQPGGGLTSPAGTGTGGATPTTQLDATVSVATAVERGNALLQQIAINTTPREEPAAEKTARDQADATRQTASILSRIEAIIQEAVRTQVQEAAKAITGANKRGVPA